MVKVEEVLIWNCFVKVRNTNPKHKIHVRYNEETKLLGLRDQRLAEAEITAKKSVSMLLMPQEIAFIARIIHLVSIYSLIKWLLLKLS